MSGRGKMLIVLASTLVALGAVLVVHHFRVKGAANRYKAALTAQGEKLSWQELLPPPLMPDANSASLFMSLAARLPQSGPLATNHANTMAMIAPGKAMAGWALPWVGGYSIGHESNSWEEALADYKAQEGLLDEFHALLKQPAMDLRLDYSQGANLLLPHLASLKRCTQRLCGAAACELHSGNPAAALPHLRAALALAHERPQEPIVITELVRIAIAAIAGSATWDYLQAPGLRDQDLEALQQDWSEMTFFASTERTFMGERCFMLQSLAQMRDSSAEFSRLTGMSAKPLGTGGGGDLLEQGLNLAEESWERTKFGVAEGAWRVSWSHTDELRMLRGQQALLEIARRAAADGHASNALRLEAEFKASGQIPQDSGESAWFGGTSLAAFKTMFSDGVASVERAFSKTLQAEVNARMVTTAIALERHRLRQGAYPAELTALVPDILESVPRDPADGAPLRYRRTGDDRYLLYSVGQDLVDDGGNPLNPDRTSVKSLGWIRGRDWVWSQPATRAEVRTWWESELEQNYHRLRARPDDEAVIDAVTGLPDPPPHLPETPEQRRSNITNLAREWTAQYFTALTNAGIVNAEPGPRAWAQPAFRTGPRDVPARSTSANAERCDRGTGRGPADCGRLDLMVRNAG